MFNAHNEQQVDGDAMWAEFIKEMDEVLNYMKMHPMTTMVSGNGRTITGDVNLTDQDTVNFNAWIHDDL